MAFIQTNYVLASYPGYETQGSRILSYRSSTDTIAVIKASGYFNTATKLPLIGDAIIILGTDGSDIIRVTAVSPNVTVVDWVNISASEIPLADGSMLIGNASNVAAPIAVKSYVLLDGRFTTVGGDAVETITATGAVAGDQAIVIVHTRGATPRYVQAAACGTDDITVTLDGDPSTDHVLYWQVLRTTT